MAVASGNAGGFECSFIGDVKEFECPLCLHVTRDPNLTSCCGQHFCQSCISRIIADRKPCPFCKESRFTVLLDKKQKRRVLDLKVKCIECSRGCFWTGPLGDLDNHGSKDCGFTYISCPNDCVMEVQRRFLEDHVAKSCPKRNFRCKYCGYEDTYELIIWEHISGCPKYPVSCPNNCTANMFVRATLNEHIKQGCPLQQVNCEYKSFGCTSYILRKDMPKHMEDNIQQHMLLVTKELKTTRETLSGVIVELNTTKEKLSGATKELKLTNEKLSEAEGTIATLTEKVTLLENGTLTVPLIFYVHKVSQLKSLRNVKLIGTYTLLTHLNGYKLYLNCFATDSHLTFYIGKIDTKNDKKLRWPLRCTVIVTILNQNSTIVHMKESSDVCVENNDTVRIPNVFNITSAEIVRAVSYDRLQFKFDIVNINKLT